MKRLIEETATALATLAVTACVAMTGPADRPPAQTTTAAAAGPAGNAPAANGR